MTGFHLFKFVNRVNAILRPLTNGRVQLFNKFQTEEQARLLYKNFKVDLERATKEFVGLGLISDDQKRQWDKLPLRNKGVSERYAFIGLSKLLGL